MLDDLVVMVHAADKVLREDKEGDHGDQSGANGEDNPSFGHLIILIRDVEGKAKEIEDHVLGKEQTRSLKHKQRVKAGGRNVIREGLEASFESITFHTMPIPHPDIAGAARVEEDTPWDSCLKHVFPGFIWQCTCEIASPRARG